MENLLVCNQTCLDTYPYCVSGAWHTEFCEEPTAEPFYCACSNAKLVTNLAITVAIGHKL